MKCGQEQKSVVYCMSVVATW